MSKNYKVSTPEQKQATEDDLRCWADWYPTAAKALRAIYRKHNSNVGYRFMGQLLMVIDPTPVTVQDQVTLKTIEEIQREREKAKIDRDDLFPVN